jgi:hypothetical protein
VLVVALAGEEHLAAVGHVELGLISGSVVEVAGVAVVEFDVSGLVLAVEVGVDVVVFGCFGDYVLVRALAFEHDFAAVGHVELGLVAGPVVEVAGVAVVEFGVSGPVLAVEVGVDVVALVVSEIIFWSVPVP